MTKVTSYMAYIYLAPVIISLYYIGANGSLLGDFRGDSYNLDFINALSILLYYSIPLLVIYFFVKISGRLHITDCEANGTERFFFALLVVTFVITILFGANQIGQDAQPGFSGLMIKIASKLNPLAILPLLAFSAISRSKFIISIAIVIFYSYMQSSLQGVYISVLSLGAYILLNYNIKKFMLYLLYLVPLIFIGQVLELVTYLYTIRNEIRGVPFNVDEILSLAIGRISTTSSLITILSNNYNATSVSDYFSIGIFIERIFGLQLFNNISPSQVFNAAVIGPDAGYSIFMGLPGFLAFLMKGYAATFILNTLVMLILLVLIYLLVPVINKKNRIAAFFLVMYLPFLSFDVWEISILFQTIIIWHLLLFLRKICFRVA